MAKNQARIAMAQGAGNEHDGNDEVYRDMDFASASFPSDAVSVKRLRTLFPDRFDGVGTIADGFTDCDFFSPPSPDKPYQLAEMTTLLREERIVATGAYHRQYLDRQPNLLGLTELEILAEAEANLEELYQHFKLADGPETARFLIEQVNAEGIRLAQAEKSRGK